MPHISESDEYSHMKKKILAVMLAALCMALPVLTGCGNGGSGGSGAAADESVPAGEGAAEEALSSELTFTERMDLAYAQCFTVDRYEGGYALITIRDGDRYLLVPEGAEAPADLPEDVWVIKGPVKNTYVAGTADMDYFLAMNAMDCVGFTSLEADGWYLPEVPDLIENGDILFAGKYSAPDYELLLGQGCDLIIENTMILHSPAILEQLRAVGFPVLVDYSSYEPDIRGRMEWIRLYGLLCGHEAEAEAAFEAQAAAATEERENTGKTVAFFYITSSGTFNVRNSDDYVAQMIELAGGRYIFDDLSSGNATGTTSIQVEEFLAAAADVDYLIYNSTIEGEMESIDDLLERCPQLADCRAVREGHVFTTGKSMYQSVMELGTVVSDIHAMLTGEGGMVYIEPLS